MTSAKALSGTVWDADPLEHNTDSRVVLELYDREQDSLRRYAVWIGVDFETAEEVVQETFLKLHQHLLAGGDRSHLRAWLFRVAHNLVRNSQSSSHRARTTTLADFDMLAQMPAGQASAEDELLDREQQKRLRNAMNVLSPAQKSCLVLRAEGLKYREIADTLGLSVSTVAENVQRGLERLKENV